MGTETLDEVLSSLEQILQKQKCPGYSSVAVVFEEDAISAVRGKLQFRSSSLHGLDEARSRFFLISGRPYSWINVSALGLYNSILVVSVSVPRALSKPGIRTSINVSGAVNEVVDSAWNIGRVIEIVA